MATITRQPNKNFNALMVIGERYHSIPESLYRDDKLTHRARYLWQLLKLENSPYKGNHFPSYEEMQLWLSDQAFLGKRVSRKIVTQTLFLLRLTRWISLCETERDERGRIVGNVYLIHNEPVPLIDAVEMTENYYDFVLKQIHSKDAFVAQVATAVLNEIEQHQNAGQGHLLYSQIAMEQERLQRHRNSQIQLNHLENSSNLDENLNIAVNNVKNRLGIQERSTHHQEKIEHREETKNMTRSLRELGKHSLSSVRELSKNDLNSLSSIMELSKNTEFHNGTWQAKNAKSLISDLVPSRNSSTSTNTNISTYSTSTNTGNVFSESLREFNLSFLEKENVIALIEKLTEDQARQVILEVKIRMEKHLVNKPKGLLINLLKKAITGNFNPYLCKQRQQEPTNIQTEKTRTAIAPCYRIFKAEPVKPLTEMEKQKHREMAAQLRKTLQGIN